MNLTLTIDAELLRRARVEALNRGTSVNALVRDYLTALVDDPERRRRERGLRQVLDLAEKSTWSSEGRRWTRDELHDR